MDRQKLALSIAIIILGFVCFVLGCISVAIPYWGTFRSRVREERGHFGPWTMCKDIGYGRDLCGSAISSFRLMTIVRAAGICAAIGTATLGFYCLASIFQISMQVTRSRILFQYHQIVFIKLCSSICTAITIIAAVSLFAFQSDDLERGYIVEASFCFYMEIILAIFTFILMLLTIVEYTALRKLRLILLLNGAQDITSNGRSSNRHPSGAKKRSPPKPKQQQTQTTNLLPQMGFGTTIGNPGFRDAGGGIHTNGIAMTDSSARFVPSVPSQNVLIKNSSNSLLSPSNSNSINRRIITHKPPPYPQTLQIPTTKGPIIINNPASASPLTASPTTPVSMAGSTSSLPKSPKMSRLALARQLSIEKKERKKARKMIRSVVKSASTGDGKRKSRSRSPSPAPSTSSNSKKSKPRFSAKRSLFNIISSSSHVPPSPTTPSTSTNTAEWTNDSVSIIPTPESINGDSTMSVDSSLSTISTIASTIITPINANPMPRGPLRSSLKKPKPVSTPDDSSIDSVFGYTNLGFSTASPTPSRTGSLKKVRIQTMSTDV